MMLSVDVCCSAVACCWCCGSSWMTPLLTRCRCRRFCCRVDVRSSVSLSRSCGGVVGNAASQRSASAVRKLTAVSWVCCARSLNCASLVELTVVVEAGCEGLWMNALSNRCLMLS